MHRPRDKEKSVVTEWQLVAKHESPDHPVMNLVSSSVEEHSHGGEGAVWTTEVRGLHC